MQRGINTTVFRTCIDSSSQAETKASVLQRLLCIWPPKNPAKSHLKQLLARFSQYARGCIYHVLLCHGSYRYSIEPASRGALFCPGTAFKQGAMGTNKTSSSDFFWENLVLHGATSTWPANTPPRGANPEKQLPASTSYCCRVALYQGETCLLVFTTEQTWSFEVFSVQKTILC